jgi:hypothetical protein
MVFGEHPLCAWGGERWRSQVLYQFSKGRAGLWFPATESCQNDGAAAATQEPCDLSDSAGRRLGVARDTCQDRSPSGRSQRFIGRQIQMYRACWTG